MGKIQDALTKLQNQRPNPGAATRNDTLGTIRKRDDDSRITPVLRHNYGGDLVEVNQDALRESGLLATVSEQKRIADQYRQIKRPIFANALGKRVTPVARGNLLMVASAVPGEGKTFTCVNLALSIAMERDWSVILVDADCSKPHITNLFGLSGRPGLLDVLRESVSTFDEYVMPTSIPNLAVMSAGRQDALASELLSSDRMDRLCQKLSDEDPKRMIVFDTSPLLYTTEAPIISGHVGQVALVVAAERTSQVMVQNALEMLDSSKAINLILNKARSDSGIAGDYYGYGYGEPGDDADVPSEN